MFVRKKKNKSGVVSVQIIDKSSGSYKMLKTIGSSSDLAKIDRLILQGKKWIEDRMSALPIDFSNASQITEHVLDNIEQINVSGTRLLLGKLFDEIGFNKIEGELFKTLVISRLSFPVSKLKTVDFLEKHHSIHIGEDVIYRYLDKLYKKEREHIQQIGYRHTLKVLNNTISVVFYDVTTLYFQIDDEDQVRKRGFSKEGKHQNPQIVLGLLVSVDGYPLAFEIFEGNKFEGPQCFQDSNIAHCFPFYIVFIHHYKSLYSLMLVIYDKYTNVIVTIHNYVSDSKLN